MFALAQRWGQPDLFGTSVMPIGFEALPPDDLKALIEYLAQAH
jgi:hypothetical protein